MPEQALIDSDAHGSVLNLTPGCRASQLPGDLADLGKRLGGDGLTEARQPTRRVDGNRSAQAGDAVSKEPLGVAFFAQPNVLVPVELESSRQVVDLRKAEFVRPYPCLGVGSRRDGVAKRQRR